MKMALQFDVNVGVAEDFDQAFDRAARRFQSTIFEGKSQRTIVVAGEAN